MWCTRVLCKRSLHLPARRLDVYTRGRGVWCTAEVTGVVVAVVAACEARAALTAVWPRSLHQPVREHNMLTGTSSVSLWSVFLLPLPTLLPPSLQNDECHFCSWLSWEAWWEQSVSVWVLFEWCTGDYISVFRGVLLLCGSVGISMWSPVLKCIWFWPVGDMQFFSINSRLPIFSP